MHHLVANCAGQVSAPAAHVVPTAWDGADESAPSARRHLARRRRGHTTRTARPPRTVRTARAAELARVTVARRAVDALEVTLPGGADGDGVVGRRRTWGASGGPAADDR